MFDRSSDLYDAIYHWKDYPGEVRRLKEIIGERLPHARTLLDVACGTGLHLQHLAEDYEVEGLDLSEEFVAIASKRLPDVPLHRAGMENFDLGREFDVVTCLFSSVGYVQTPQRLEAAVATMTHHLSPEGLLILEPWFSPDEFEIGHLGAVFVDEENLKIARINDSYVRDDVSHFTFHYLVGTRDGISYFTEEHSLGLFTPEQYRGAMERAGLMVTHDPHGLMGRGLYVGAKGSG